MPDILKPRDAKEVEDAVRWALGHDKALEVAGQGTKRAIGRPSQTDITLDLSGLTGVTLYEPAEPRGPAVAEGSSGARACAAMAAAMGSPCDVSAAAHLPDHVASYFDGLPNAEAATVLRLEGVGPSVAHRKDVLAKLMQTFG